MRLSLSFSISTVSSRFVLERGGPTSLGLRRRIGDTGAVCSSESANWAKASGEESGVVMVAVDSELDEGSGRISRGEGVGVCCALRACNALRKSSDLGAMAKEPVRVMLGLFWSGVCGRCCEAREESSDDGAVDMVARECGRETIDRDSRR